MYLRVYLVKPGYASVCCVLNECFNGKEKIKIEPGSAFSTQILPQCRVMISLQIYSPNPNPEK
jgi:hypothetical protein